MGLASRSDQLVSIQGKFLRSKSTGIKIFLYGFQLQNGTYNSSDTRDDIKYKQPVVN